MQVMTLKYYLQTLTDERYLVMDEKETIYGTGGPEGNLLADAVLNQPMVQVMKKPCMLSDRTDLILLIQPL